MTRRHNESSLSIGVTCRRLSLLALVFVEQAVLGHDAAAQTEPLQIVRWQIAATVINIGDPDGIFPEVRLGDPVRGTLTYDINNFDYPAWFGLVTMTIENPRTGNELRFMNDLTAPFANVSYYDGYPEDDESPDELTFYQAVMPPAGFTGFLPSVAMWFIGPPGVLSGENPLEELDLEDWPDALISFYGYDNALGISPYIDAEIRSLTPIESPFLPGDFDYDNDVDDFDLYAWSESFGPESFLYADADANGSVDGADFLAWQRGLGATAVSLVSGVVPEPGGSLLLTASLAAIWRYRRSAKQTGRYTNPRAW
jgi:hypothetical protein